MWLTGAALAGITAPLAWVRLGVAESLPFIAASILLLIGAAAVWRCARWALVLSLVLLGGQLFGVVGTSWELTHEVNEAKARELRDLGFNPRLAVALNLAYSLVASGVFVWVLIRMRTRRTPPAADRRG